MESITPTLKRIRILGIVVALAGLSVTSVGFLYGLPLAEDGLASADSVYEAQGVELHYNEQGQLTDRDTVEGAQAIMSLLVDEWQYPVDMANFDPDDPLVNTRDELMFQYATLTYHTRIREVTVTLTEEDVPITYRGITYDEPGDYEIMVEKYYAELDRSNPIERQLRDAWSPTYLGLTATLTAGHANQAAGELARMTSLAMGATGLLFVLVGGGLIWVTSSHEHLAKHLMRQLGDRRD